MVQNFLNRRKSGDAFSIAKTAYEVDVTVPESKLIYALTALYDGKENLAKELLGEGYKTTLYNDLRFVRALVELGRHQELVEVWKGFIEREPNKIEHRLSLAATYLAMGLRQSAIAEITKAKTLTTDQNILAQFDFYISEIRAGRDPSRQ